VGKFCRSFTIGCIVHNNPSANRLAGFQPAAPAAAFPGCHPLCVRADCQAADGTEIRGVPLFHLGVLPDSLTGFHPDGMDAGFICNHQQTAITAESQVHGKEWQFPVDFAGYRVPKPVACCNPATIRAECQRKSLPFHHLGQERTLLIPHENACVRSGCQQAAIRAVGCHADLRHHPIFGWIQLDRPDGLPGCRIKDVDFAPQGAHSKQGTVRVECQSLHVFRVFFRLHL